MRFLMIDVSIYEDILFLGVATLKLCKVLLLAPECVWMFPFLGY